MKKAGKKEKERLAKAVSEEYEREGDSSDDEMPEVVSNATMKSNQEVLNKELDHLKQQLRHAEKIKRRHKQEIFIAQKKAKGGRLEFDVTDDKDQSFANAAPESSLRKPNEAAKKIYSSLNITVEPLTNVQDSRASAALNFKSRRMAKVPRESIKTAVISYQKKLLTRK